MKWGSYLSFCTAFPLPLAAVEALTSSSEGTSGLDSLELEEEESSPDELIGGVGTLTFDLDLDSFAIDNELVKVWSVEVSWIKK